MSINLNQILSSQFAETQASNINANFTTLKNAVENIPSGGGGSDSGASVRTYINILPNQWMYDTTFTKLKVLCIGNSFLAYPLSALGNVFTLSAADASTYLMQQIASSSMTLAGALNNIKNGGVSTANGFYTRYFGSGGSGGSSANYKSMISGNWDAIIFQQKSDESADYGTYYPELPALIDAARHFCTNSKVRIGWHMIWDKKHGTSSQYRDSILLNAKRVMDDFGIDFIVPAGTAFENAWANGMTLQMDGSGHPTNAASQWLVSATWYQALFSEFVGKDIVTDMTPSVSQSWTTIGGSTLTADVATCTLANKCAKAACNDMWNVTTNIS